MNCSKHISFSLQANNLFSLLLRSNAVEDMISLPRSQTVAIPQVGTVAQIENLTANELQNSNRYYLWANCIFYFWLFGHGVGLGRLRTCGIFMFILVATSHLLELKHRQIHIKFAKYCCFSFRYGDERHYYKVIVHYVTMDTIATDSQ